MKLRRKGTPSVPVDTKDGATEGQDDDTLEGPKALTRRGCTDIFCLILFIFFWFGNLYIMYLATTVGDPYSVLYGKDYLGNRCGRGDFTHRPKTIYPRIDKDILEQSAIATTAPWKLVLYGLCVETCPNVTDPTVCFNDPGKCMAYDYGREKDWKAAGGSEYYFQVMPTISLINRCIPIEKVDAERAPVRCAFPQCDNVTNPWMECDTEFPTLWKPRGFWQQSQCQIKYDENTLKTLATQQPSPLVDQIASKMALGQKIVDGLMDAQDVLLKFGILCPFVLGFTWLIVLRFFAKTVVYATLAAIGVGLFLLACYLFIITGLLNELLAEVLASNVTSQILALGSEIAPDVIGDLGSGDAGSGSIVDAAASAESIAEDVTALLPPGIADKAAASQQENPTLWRLAAWATLVLTAVYWVLMFLWRAKIKLVAALIKEGSVVIKDRPSSIAFPFFVFVAKILLLVFFIIGILFLGTADITADHFTGSGFPLTSSATFAQLLQQMNSTLQSEGADAMAAGSSYLTTKNACYVYFLFGFLWTNEIFNNIGWTTLAGSFSHWYFFRRDTKQSTRFPLSWAAFRTFRYHLGSIAFGSFIIAAVQLVRIAMMYLDKQTKKLQESNKLMKLVIKTAQCALFCLEKTLKFITAYCYIYVAMQGTGFCMSCFATFKLIMSQTAQLALNTLVGTVLGLLQLLGMPLLCAFLANAVLTARNAEQPLYATGVVLVMALVIAKAFSIIFACVLDTLFVCCIRDKNEYKAAFMSDRLYVAFGFDPAEREGGGGKETNSETKQTI